MRETVWRVLHGVGWTMVVGAILLAVLLAAPGLLGAERTYVVESGSMEPAIGTGDVVVVTATSPAHVTVGDVISFHSPEATETGIVTHRVVDVLDAGNGRAFRTKGDANEQVDSAPVPAAAVVGTVAFTIPYLGHLVVFAQSDLGLLALVVMPGLLLVVTEAYDLYASGSNVEHRDAGGDT